MRDSPDHSNKTYDLGLNGGQPVLSFGISHDMDFPEQDLAVGIEVFRYEFIYNDYWLDYKREGLFLSAEHEFIPRWFVNGLVGYYQQKVTDDSGPAKLVAPQDRVLDLFCGLGNFTLPIARHAAQAVGVGL